MNVIFCGSGAFGEPTLRSLVGAGHRVVHVYTQPDRPAGRGKKLTPTPMATVAGELGLPVTPTADLNAEPLPQADAMVVIAFGQKIGPAAVAHARLGSVNLHASLLPRYRGAAPINWAMLNGDAVTGNSVIRLAEKMDAGAVLGQSSVTIGDAETAGELHDRLAADGAPLVARVLAELAAGTAVETQQGHGLATLAPKLSRATAVVDWTEPAAVVARRVNGLSPWPGCRAKLMNGEAEVAAVTLLRAVPTAGPPSTPPGTLTDAGTVAAGDGLAVELLSIQPDGKRPMTVAEFRNGHPWRGGMRLVPGG